MDGVAIWYEIKIAQWQTLFQIFPSYQQKFFILIVLLIFAGASSTKSSVHTFESSEKSSVEVGPGNLKLTFSSDQRKLINYTNSKSSVCSILDDYKLRFICSFPHTHTPPPQNWSRVYCNIISLSSAALLLIHFNLFSVPQSHSWHTYLPRGGKGDYFKVLFLMHQLLNFEGSGIGWAVIQFLPWI